GHVVGAGLELQLLVRLDGGEAFEERRGGSPGEVGTGRHRPTRPLSLPLALPLPLPLRRSIPGMPAAVRPPTQLTHSWRTDPFGRDVRGQSPYPSTAGGRDGVGRGGHTTRVPTWYNGRGCKGSGPCGARMASWPLPWARPRPPRPLALISWAACCARSTCGRPGRGSARAGSPPPP